ncbi:MAG: hypothetical protein KDC46_01475 [Thermoleophilia bacterium]|nr:hypothetical protein [Thermoleophilia bacterium]
MTAHDAHPQGGSAPDPGAGWRSLSGDLPPVPSFDAQGASAAHQAQLPPQPIHGGWDGAWQDANGQWHYPFTAQQPVEQPPYSSAAGALAEPQPVVAHPVPQPQPDAQPQPADSPIVPAEQLAPVGPPRYLAPQRVARDPRQRTMAAVITFVALVIGLWGILGFLGSLSRTLSGITSNNAKIEAQMTEANVGLADLKRKTDPLKGMTEQTKVLGGLLGGIDQDMAAMLEGVDQISAGMSTMGTSLDQLDTELGRVNTINAGMAEQLGSINAGLKDQVRKVRTMRRDVQATGQVLGTLPPRLTATNARLAHVNGAVNTMGCRGVTNNLKVKISLGPIPNGSATVYATVIPPAAWGTKQDGKTPC